jgi:P4 family phage/plasmid primase-like protien
LDFGKYKNRLIEYLRSRGIEVRGEGLIRCFSPDHEDRNPSCQVSESSFYCHSCKIQGDIYDAIGILEGITDRAEQYKWAEKLFGGGGVTFRPAPQKTETPEETEDYTRDEAAEGLFEAYLCRNPATEKMIRQFLALRAAATAPGLADYPDDLIPFISKHFFYWPGWDIARQEINQDVFERVNVIKFETDEKTKKKLKTPWYHSGVVLKIGTGYKLFYYEESLKSIVDKTKSGIHVKAEKRGTYKCHSFPMPGSIDPALPVILVEAEMNALACAAVGIKNVFATGGTKGLTKPKVKKYLLDAKEIILFFDADAPGREWSGIDPLTDKYRKTNIPETIRQAGFRGKIKIAELPLPPEGSSINDQDALIITGSRDVVLKALEEAREYSPPKQTAKKTSAGLWEAFDTISIKRLKSVLNKIPRETLDDSDIPPFIAAAIHACKHSEVSQELAKWGAKPEELKAAEDDKTSPYFLIEACEKYGASKYLRNEIEKALIPASEILRRIKVTRTIVDIDFKKMTENDNAIQFITTKGVHSAAMMIADILDGRMIYVENEKRHYFFNGHTWQREPDMAGIAYNIICSVMRYFLQNKIANKGIIFDIMTKIEGRRFRVEVSQDFSGLPQVFNESALFDGPGVRETITLSDGVMDFSGGEIEYRKSRREELRREALPYKVEDVRDAADPEKFLEFMRGNFKNEKTLETLMYYISLFASRNTQYKYGGIWVGKPHTGKTTTVELLQKIYPGMIVRLNSDILVTKERRRASGNEATPYIARMEGRGAAIAQETERNGILNNALWKEWTGGDTITARGLYKEPHDFIPTAQILVCTNHQPRFDAHDDATIERMIVIPFSVQHEKGKKGTVQQNTIYARLRPEYPAIVKFFANYYIKFKNEMDGAIPLSEECNNYKQNYVQEQETDLDKFVNDNIDIDMSGSAFETVQAVYDRYLQYYNLSADDKEALSRNRFVRYLKHDYMEINYKQKKINGEPVLCFFNVKLKPFMGKTEQPNLPEEKGGDTAGRGYNPGQGADVPPDEIPF